MHLPDPAERFLTAAEQILRDIRTTQLPAIRQAAAICTEAIAAGGLAHMFGTGHSRIPVEEIYPRHGSFPGFHPIIELSLTNHTQVVGNNGQRQAMYLEKLEGFGEVILRNFTFGAHDCMLVFSNSGVNGVVIDVALGAKARGMQVIAVVSKAHCLGSPIKHSCGKRLTDIADVTIDNCSPLGDAMVTVDGLDEPVGPGSSIGYVTIVNMLKCLVAEQLTARGHKPLVLTSSTLIGSAASAALFDASYDEFRARIAPLYGMQPTKESK